MNGRRLTAWLLFLVCCSSAAYAADDPPRPKPVRAGVIELAAGPTASTEEYSADVPVEVSVAIKNRGRGRAQLEVRLYVYGADGSRVYASNAAVGVPGRQVKIAPNGDAELKFKMKAPDAAGVYTARLLVRSIFSRSWQIQTEKTLLFQVTSNASTPALLEITDVKIEPDDVSDRTPPQKISFTVKNAGAVTWPGGALTLDISLPGASDRLAFSLSTADAGGVGAIGALARGKSVRSHVAVSRDAAAALLALQGGEYRIRYAAHAEEMAFSKLDDVQGEIALKVKSDAGTPVIAGIDGFPAEFVVEGGVRDFAPIALTLRGRGFREGLTCEWREEGADLFAAIGSEADRAGQLRIVSATEAVVEFSRLMYAWTGPQNPEARKAEIRLVDGNGNSSNAISVSTKVMAGSLTLQQSAPQSIAATADGDYRLTATGFNLIAPLNARITQPGNNATDPSFGHPKVDGPFQGGLNERDPRGIEVTGRFGGKLPAAGQYELVVTDARGQEARQTFDVTVAAAPIARLELSDVAPEPAEITATEKTVRIRFRVTNAGEVPWPGGVIAVKVNDGEWATATNASGGSGAVGALGPGQSADVVIPFEGIGADAAKYPPGVYRVSLTASADAAEFTGASEQAMVRVTDAAVIGAGGGETAGGEQTPSTAVTLTAITPDEISVSTDGAISATIQTSLGLRGSLPVGAEVMLTLTEAGGKAHSMTLKVGEAFSSKITFGEAPIDLELIGMVRANTDGAQIVFETLKAVFEDLSVLERYEFMGKVSAGEAEMPFKLVVSPGEEVSGEE